MFAIFSLRLACGLLGCLPLLAPAQINPRFFRTHFLTVMGLSVVALVLPHFGWRTVFFVGVLPALIIFWIRRDVPESELWLERRSAATALLMVLKSDLYLSPLSDGFPSEKWIQLSRVPAPCRRARPSGCHSALPRPRCHCQLLEASSPRWLSVWFPAPQ